MIKITEEERDFIEKYVENGRELIEYTINTNTFGDLLDEIDLLTTSYDGMDENGDLTDFGRKAQNIHDDIFYRNHIYDEELDDYIRNN